MEITGFKYAASVRGLGPDKKPQFLERGFPGVNKSRPGSFALTGRHRQYLKGYGEIASSKSRHARHLF